MIDVDALLRRVPAKVFRQWEMYYEVEPFGDYRDDVRTAHVVSMIHNMAVEVKNRKPLTEFILPWGKIEEDEPTKTPTQSQTVEEKLSVAYHIVAMYNAGAFDPKKVKEGT